MPKGHPQNPLSFEELIAKFKSNIGQANILEEETKINEVVNSIDKLEDVNDVNKVFSLIWECSEKLM